MSQQGLIGELEQLRGRFIALVAVEAVALALALALVIGYFALHIAACLVGFAVVLAFAAAAQIAFIAAFRRDQKKGL